MTFDPSRPTSTHYSGSALNDPNAPLPTPGPTTPNGTPAWGGDADIQQVVREHLGRAIHWANMVTPVRPGLGHPTPEDVLMGSPAVKALLEWIGVLAKAKVREQKRKADKLEADMKEALAPQGVPKGIRVDRDVTTVEARHQMEGPPEVIMRARIAEDHLGGATWQVDRKRLAVFLGAVPKEGATIHAYMEDMEDEGDLQALCLEASWDYQPEAQPTFGERVAAYQQEKGRMTPNP